MILLPVFVTGITLMEIPSEISFYIEFGNCKQKCFNCHSSFLCKDVSTKTPLMSIVKEVEKAKNKGCTAVVLMGGTNNGIARSDLKTLVNKLSKILPVGIYSGTDDKWVFDLPFKWIKTGCYDDKLGGLDNKNTNQRFYEKVDGVFVDKTFLFQK